MSRPAARDAGTATVELVLLTPLVLAALAFLVVLGRVAEAESQVGAAARDAARAASLTRTPAAARQAATRAARVNLAGQRITCGRLAVTVDVRRFRPGGTVAVTVVCTTRLDDLGLTGLPAHTTVRSQFVAPLDTLVSRP